MEVEQERGKRKRGGEWKSNRIEGREREEGSGSRTGEREEKERRGVEVEQDRGKRKRGGEWKSNRIEGREREEGSGSRTG